MARRKERDDNESGAEKRPDRLWPMGAVTRRTGIGEHTLRAWERRFGVPKPRRLPSGHRRYTSEQVRHLRLVALALDRGYRAGDVVPLDRTELEQLLHEAGALPGPAAAQDVRSWLESLLGAARAFDRDLVSALLKHEATSLGVPRFLRDRVDPALREIGDAWARGTIDVRHEHFVSEVLEDRLRELRSSLEAAARGRAVVLACLPDEHHALGLQVAALEIAAAGRPVRVLGAHTPVEEIAAAAEEVGAAAVGVSISEFAEQDAAAAAVAHLRRLLPANVPLWLGGEGARALTPLPPRTERVVGLDDLDRALAGVGDDALQT